MNINIFQFLKQGTALNRNSLQSNTNLEQKLIKKERVKNTDYEKSQKYNLSDTSSDQQPDTYDPEQLDRLLRRNQNKINLARKFLGVKVSGNDIPPLIKNFTKIIKKYGLNQQLVEGLSNTGYHRPTPVQCQTLPCLFERRNIIVTAPTGTGKTLSFILPLLQNLQISRFIQAVIIAPFEELATQILHELQMVGSLSKLKFQSSSKLSQEQISSIKSKKSPGINILITTPLNFIHLFQEGTKLLKHIQYLVLDQCDKYFQQSYFDQIKTILSFFKDYNPTYALFSATIQHPIEQLFKSQFLHDCIRIEVGGKNKVLSKIQQSIQYCTNQYGKVVYLKNLILQGNFTPPILIFVQQKIRAKQLYYQLKKMIKDTLSVSNKIQIISGDKEKQQRQTILDNFEKGHYLALITTDLVARGIDFKNVNLVINYDFPNSILTYIHRVGRTGRADRQGKALTFFTEEDKPQVRSLANLLRVSGCQVPEWIMQMPKAHRKLLKKLEQYPTKRLPVGTAHKKDEEWATQLQKIDKRWVKKQIKAKKEQTEKDEEWKVVGADQQ